MVRKKGKVLLGTVLTAVMLTAQPIAAAGADGNSSGKAGVGITIERYAQNYKKKSTKIVSEKTVKTTAKQTTTKKSATVTTAQVASATTTATTTATAATTTAKSKETKPVYSSYKGWVAPAVRSVLNVREKATSGSDVVGKLNKGSVAKVLKKGSQWTKVQSGTVKGYVKNDYLVWDKNIYQYAQSHDFPKKAIVTAAALKVRQKASTEAKVISLISENDSYKILSENQDWVKVKVDGSKGYLSKDYIKVKYYFSRAVPVAVKKEKTNTPRKSTTVSSTAATEAEHASSSPESGQSSNIRSNVVNYALKFVGNKYVYGGESLTNGVDCSGFTMKVYAHFGYSLSHGSSAQAGEGKTISISSVRPGDLLFYKRGGRINHVTMYIGNGKVVHASNSAPYPKGGIKVSSINYRTPCKAVRIIR